MMGREGNVRCRCGINKGGSMRTTLTTAVAGTMLLVATGACTRSSETQPSTPATAPISEADATKIADATENTWRSMDAASIKALYAPGIVGFDAGVAPLSTDRATWDKLQDGYAAARLDKITDSARKIQVLSADVFVMSGIADATSSSTPANNAVIRYTDVFEKQPDGTWLIVNEHTSIAPKG